MNEPGQRELIMKDGPFAKCMQMAPHAHLKYIDYGLAKIRKRNQYAKYLQSRNNLSRGK